MARAYNKNAKQLIAGARELLGVLPDKDIAEQLGVSTSSVSNFRRAHAIPAAGAEEVPRGKKGGRGKRADKTVGVRPSRIAAYQERLGKVADREIAELAGVSVGAVQSYRRRHGIAAAGGDLPPEPGEVVRTPRARVQKDAVWRVLGVDQATFVVANSIVEAARRAEQAGFTGGIERVGVALA